MNYFTADLLTRLQDHADEQRYLAALDSWERALEAYRTQLKWLRPRLPRGLRKLLAAGSLHDALVVDMWKRKHRFNVTLLPAADLSTLAVLNYSLVESPRIDRAALPEPLRSTQVTWLYDELTDETEDCEGKATFGHNILLSNGWEIHLRFRSVIVTRPDPLVPVPLQAGGDPSTLSRSA